MAWPHPQWAEDPGSTLQLAMGLGEPDTWAPSSHVRVREEHTPLVVLGGTSVRSPDYLSWQLAPTQSASGQPGSLQVCV